MDVLRPPLINIKGRIYRKNTIKEDNYEDEEEEFSYTGPPGVLKQCLSSICKSQAMMDNRRHEL